jgi:hypothetical protein
MGQLQDNLALGIVDRTGHFRETFDIFVTPYSQLPGCCPSFLFNESQAGDQQSCPAVRAFNQVIDVLLRAKSLIVGPTIPCCRVNEPVAE